MKFKVLDLFSGKGACVSAMRDLGIEIDIIGFSEILPHAINSYKKIHNVSEDKNLGDVVGIKNMKLPSFDILLSGSPCQDLTNEGNLKGGEKDSGTRSSLLWEQVKIAEKYKPKYIIWENVRGLTFARSIGVLNEYISDLDDIGYNTYYKLLNANNYNSVQKRERNYIISIRKDLDDGSFEFPKPIPYTQRMIDKLEPFIPRLQVTQNAYDSVVLERLGVNEYKIRNGTVLGYLIAIEGDTIDFAYRRSKTRRGRVQRNACHTIKTVKEIAVVQDDKIRFLSSREYWRVQEFSDEEYDKAKASGCTDEELYSLAGNSINLNVLKEIFKILFKL